MGSEVAEKSEIPCIALSGDELKLDRNSEEWKGVTKKVREAFEEFGCFVVEYGKFPLELQEELLKTTKEMFDLPEETKLKYTKPTPKDGGYIATNPFIPLAETFGVNGGDEVQFFEKLMWPQGKPGFCEVLNTANVKMHELSLLILRMIFESFGLGEYYNSKALDENIIGKLRAIKYKVPKANEDGIGLKTHVDKSIISVLCQNSVQGLEALTKDGNWITVNIPKGGLVIIVGNALVVWSNGRLKALIHRVVMTGEKERYSCGFFSIPKDEVTIEVPQDLVDEEHPCLYKPFVYSEYLAKHLASDNLDSLKDYAGV